MTAPTAAFADLIRLLSNSRIVDIHRLIAHGRELAADLGLPCAPVGAGNSKTGTPGTYRPVGPSCPQCPVAAGCYARFGPVGLHQARSTTNPIASVTAAIIAMVAALRSGTSARLHVSGDFYQDHKLDEVYLGMLEAQAASIHEQATSQMPLAWTYTHANPKEFESWRLRLADAGIEVVYSGLLDVGGAVVWPHSEVSILRDLVRRPRLIPCPAQTNRLSCRECGLCWQTRTKEVCIVFDPHGRGAANLDADLLSRSQLGPFKPIESDN
jgi:hypothetical protein